MKPLQKRILAVLCALTLVAGTALASSAVTTRTLEARYMGITLTVDGRPVAPADEAGNPVEPFAVDGTVYLPVRAVGEALNRNVTWDGETNTVAIDSALLSDAKQLVNMVERTHPAFVLDDVPEGYEAARAEFLSAAADPDMALSDFYWAAMAYMAAMKDGHTQVYAVDYSMPRLEIQWTADGDKLYLLDGEGRVTGQEVTSIGGLSVGEVFSAVDRYFPAENKAYEDKNHGSWTKLQALLVKAGADCAGTSAQITVLDGGKELARTVTIAPMTPNGSEGEYQSVSHQLMGDVFYIDMNECSLSEANAAAAEALKEAVESGVDKVIIDVRGNGGGNSMACEQLLNAMGMEAPGYGVYIRFSPLALGTYPDSYDTDEGGYYYDGRAEAPGKPNPAVKLAVLTDEGTFSSATMMGVFAQDGGLGVVIGRPSSNAPSSYGDVLPIVLLNSGLEGVVSYKQWQRPDPEADPKMLHPDIETELGEDVLQVALNYLRGEA